MKLDLDKIVNLKSVEKLENIVMDKLPLQAKQKQVLQRRVNKLKKDPMGFIDGSIAKRKEQARKYLPIKYDGKFNYTVVSAVYNVEKYLDEYFESLVNQSLNFKKHIHLILVDDGSTDNSASIIKKWQKKYPKNIHYYYKENGGQASARNLGLQYVETEWVTFIDPDDFVGMDYFKNTDEILEKNQSVKILVANTIFYMESKDVYKDSHPLRYRFHQKDKKFPINNLGKNINLSAAASIFSTKIILDNNIEFDHSVKPNFEDGKFIGEFLLHAQNFESWFANNVIYNYRKRDDGTSTLDGSWFKEEKYSNVLEYGFLSLLNNYKIKLGVVPQNIQFTAMYDMYWYLVHLLNQPEKINFLSNEQKERYYQLYDEVMQFIDVHTIMNFGVAGAWFFHKVGFLGAFKGERPPFQICYIESIDKAKQQVLISHFDYFNSPVSYQLSGQDVVPQQQKLVENIFNDKLFVYEKRAWIAYNSLNEVLSIYIDGKPARLALSNLAHQQKYKIADIKKAFTSPKYESDDSWLLMDRETKADDNAEHLYRYLKQNYPEQKCYFALNRDSKDWDRLANDGFSLVAFGEPDFELRLAKANKIISSHIEAHIHNYFGDLYGGTKQFVFLQHGVTKDNLSRWLNGKKHVACFITTTKDEYQSIAVGERYKFGKKETALTGFPRHDELHRKNANAQPNKIILIMPTWRSYLMGETVGKGANTRELNLSLLDSNYAQSWLSFLRSEKLNRLVEEHGYQVIFAPHANIEPYLSHMDLPSYLQIWQASQADESMQDLFVKAKLLITDYSSVAFEMAYIGKPTLYYQFDKDEFFSGTHSYQKGYFDYEQHGFGAVSYDEESLLVQLENWFNNGVGEEYQYRIDNTFEFQDDNNCERVYQAIKALDEPSENAVNTEILADMLDNAYRHQAWDLVVSRANALNECGVANQTHQHMLLEALMAKGQWQQAKEILSSLPASQFAKESTQASYQLGDWQGVVSAYRYLTEPDFIETYDCLQALGLLRETAQARVLVDNLSALALTDGQKLATNLHELMLDGEYYAVIDLKEQAGVLSVDDLKMLKTELIFAKAHRMLGEYDLAHNQLVAFEKHTKNDVMCRLEIANLAFDRKHYGKCISQFETLMKLGYTLQASEQETYLNAIFLAGQYDKYVEIFEDSELDIHAPDQAFRVAFIHKDWQCMIDEYANIEPDFSHSYMQLDALMLLDRVDEAKSLILKMLDSDLTDGQLLVLDIRLSEIDGDYQNIVACADAVGALSEAELKAFKPQIALAKAHRMLGEYDLAHNQLVAFEKHTKNDVMCRLEIANLAFDRKHYGKCISQFETLMKLGYTLQVSEQETYLNAIFLAGQYDKYVEIFEDDEKQITSSNQAFRMNYIHQDWQAMTENYHKIMPDFVDMMLYLQALIKLGQMPIAKALLDSAKGLNDEEQLLVDLMLFDLNQEYQAISDLAKQTQNINGVYQKLFKTQLIFAKAYRMLGEYDLAHGQLVAFEKHTGNDLDCRLEIAELAFFRKHYNKCIDQFDKVIGFDYVLNDKQQYIYWQAVHLSGQHDRYVRFVENHQFDVDELLMVMYIKSLTAQHQWQKALDIADAYHLSQHQELVYELALAQYRLGRFDELHKTHQKPTGNHCYEYWLLITELALLMNDKELERYCYRGMIAVYPERDKQANMDRLMALQQEL